jgi:hypothetical protein
MYRASLKRLMFVLSDINHARHFGECSPDVGDKSVSHVPFILIVSGQSVLWHPLFEGDPPNE